MGTAAVYGASQPITLADTDGNGRDEIIGRHKTLNVSGISIRYYEYDPVSKTFPEVVLLNPTPGGSFGSGDADEDGYQEVYYMWADSVRIKEASADSQYATANRKSLYPRKGSYPSNMGIGDFDKDGKTEIAWMKLGENPGKYGQSSSLLKPRVMTLFASVPLPGILIVLSPGVMPSAILTMMEARSFCR
ncbi:MAG: hypothetical protein H6629_14945 [Calditrichae bacterium]|nr:hypothetical protein [Calditrichia bacterium]